MFESNRYLVRRKLLSFLGTEFEVFDEKEQVVLYAKQKAFKWREELKLFADKARTEEVIGIKARNIIDFSATYDVTDLKTGKKIGTLRRKGMKSILRDEWVVLDEKDQEVGSIMEDSMGMAIFRRFLFNLLPQDYDYVIGGEKVADLKQRFNPFVFKMDVDVLNDKVDKRIVISAAVLISLIEGRQE